MKDKREQDRFPQDIGLLSWPCSVYNRTYPVQCILFIQTPSFHKKPKHKKENTRMDGKEGRGEQRGRKNHKPQKNAYKIIVKSHKNPKHFFTILPKDNKYSANIRQSIGKLFQDIFGIHFAPRIFVKRGNDASKFALQNSRICYNNFLFFVFCFDVKT